MPKRVLKVQNPIDIGGDISKLTEFLKMKNVGYKFKKIVIS